MYVSGEESAEQIKLRADRLGIDNDNILFLSETDIDNVEIILDKEEPSFVIIDSIQTMYSEDITSAPGSVSQVREITARIMKMCKQKQITTVIIGHVTKDGNIAGPRILRTVKNRFGSTNEIGMFEMEEKGLIEITNPSSILISERDGNPSGSIIAVSLEGTRPLLVELQALTTFSVFGIPRRNAIGIDYNRLTLLMAVLEKKANLQLGNQDVYLNIVGGIRVNEPALDLPAVLAVASSLKNISIKEDVVAIGEVGLTGEVRSVNMIDKRIKEAEKLGYKTCIIPESNKKLLKEKHKLDIIGARNIVDAMKYLGLK